jgi:hypothetical protein
VKVFKMNDCECVCAENKEKALEWYSEEFGYEGIDDIVNEVDKNTHMWYSMDAECLKEYLKEHRNEVIKIQSDRNGELCEVLVTYEWAIKKDEITQPCVISSTEF